MAKLSLDQIKAAFESGDKPTEQDYINLIDTLAAQATDLGTAGNNEQEISGIENNTVVDSFPRSEWRLVKYMVSISKTTDGDNKFYATELTVLVDTNNVSVSQFGLVDNDGDMGTVLVSEDEAGFVRLELHPNPSIRPVTLRFARMGLKS